MRILVTGASGFIASHLIPALAEAGHDVTACFRAGCRSWKGVTSLAIAEQQDVAAWKSVMAGMDAVVNLAGLAHMIGIPDDALDYHTPNVVVAEALAVAARSAAVRHLLLISTIAVYGESEQVNHETAEAPVNAYGRSKLEGELRVGAVLAGGPTSLTVVRPPLVYGKGNPGNLARLEDLIMRGIPLPLVGLSSRRSYVYVGNLVSFIMYALESGRCNDGTFLVSDGRPVELRELLAGLADRLGRPCRLFWAPRNSLLAGAWLLDQVNRVTTGKAHKFRDSVGRLLGSLAVDDSYTRRTTGWTQPFDFDEAIRLG
jgi:nucleoside-diphosphate-sugar epimerase